MIRRCVGMADEGDSKSLVLITRVGSTPTTGIKRKPSSLSGGLSFLSAACAARTALHTLPKEASRFCRDVSFLYAVPPACAGSSVPPYSSLAGSVFLPPVFIVAVLPGISGNDRLFCRKVILYPRKKHQNPAPTIYSTVSYRFYNVFYEKGFTNEFQKHII